MLFTKAFSFKIMLSNFFFENLLFKNARKTQKLRIVRGKLNQNVIFCVQVFFKNMLFLKKNFSSESCFRKIYSSSKSDAS